MTIEKLKQNIDLMYSTANGIESSAMGANVQNSGIDSPLYSLLKGDLMCFVLYLIGVNGPASSRDVRFFNYLFDMTAGLSELQEAIDTSLDIEEYANCCPKTLDIYITCDKHLAQAGTDTDGKYSALYLILLVNIAETLVGYYDTPDAKEASLRLLRKLEMYRSVRLSNVLTEKKRDRKAPSEIQLKTDSTDDSDTLNTLLKQLDELVGMDRVKQDVHSSINLMRIREVKKQRGLPQNDISLHMVFMGNPGTGKTTVARLIAKIYQKLGVLSKGHLVEVDRSGLVAGYVGQTALKVQEKITEARGGVLFIDEAHALTANRDSSDFGFEAVCSREWKTIVMTLL